jgi:putative transcriptional regulator
MKTMDLLNISILVKELRQQLKLTQEQFAQKVGTTYSTVNHWENGKRMPQPYFIRRLLEIRDECDTSNNGYNNVTSNNGKRSSPQGGV